MKIIVQRWGLFVIIAFVFVFSPIFLPLFLPLSLGSLIGAVARAETQFSGCGGDIVAPTHADYEERVVELVNSKRAENGLPPMKAVPELANAARYHAADMVQDGYFNFNTYDRVDGALVQVCLWYRRAQAYYPTPHAENTAQGFPSPETVVAVMLSNLIHKGKLLSNDHEIGVGYASAGTPNWVISLGSRENVYPLVINGEARSTSSQTVTIYIYGNWSQMRLRNNNDNWSDWLPFQNEFAWQLSVGNGLQTVEAEMRNASSSTTASDSIRLASGPLPTATPTQTPWPTYTPINTPTAMPTDTPTATSTAIVPPAGTPTETPTETPTALPTDTPSAPPTSGPNTPLPTDMPTATELPTELPTDTPTATELPTDTPTATATATSTSTATPISTATATATATLVPLPPTAPVPDASLHMTLEQSKLVVGQQFELEIAVMGGKTPFDQAAAFINFDPTVLQVVGVVPGNAMTIVEQNYADNSAGHVDFAARANNTQMIGTVTLARLTMRAIGVSENTTFQWNTAAARTSTVLWQNSPILAGGNQVSASVRPISTATLNGQVALEGRPAPPHARWQVPLVVNLHTTDTLALEYSFKVTTDDRGAFQITGIEPGSYLLAVYGEQTLQRVQNITLAKEQNSLDLGTLHTGDATDDNQVNVLDFSLMAKAIDSCKGDTRYAPTADFSGNDCIDDEDVPLLQANFGAQGEALAEQSLRISGVNVSELTVIRNKQAGDEFTLAINIPTELGAAVDAAALYLNFDPTLLQVKHVTVQPAFDVELINQVHNQAGHIDIAAGVLRGSIATPFDFVTVTFVAQSTITSSPIVLETTGERQSDLAYRGASLHTNMVDALPFVVRETTAQRTIFLPLITR